MQHKLLPRWIGTALSGVTLALGCNHVHHDCDCCTTTYPVRVTALPSSPPPAVVAAPVAPTRLPEPEVVKKEAPPPANLSITCVQTASPLGTSGSVNGTLELTAADAEAMGIRPGYTPGALFMPLDQGNVVAHSKDVKQGQPAEGADKSNSTESATGSH